MKSNGISERDLPRKDMSGMYQLPSGTQLIAADHTMAIKPGYKGNERIQCATARAALIDCRPYVTHSVGKQEECGHDAWHLCHLRHTHFPPDRHLKWNQDAETKV
jgi:hypothetical protein